MCQKLGIQESMYPLICDTVTNVMEIIKQNDGTKRARVKDGIILTCIQYTHDSSQSIYLSAADLAKRIGLDIKYVTKAEKLVLELINRHKLNIKRETILKTKTPYQYLTEVIDKHSIRIPRELLAKVETLINYCETNDLLLDHTPLSIGVCCLYYILKQTGIKCDIKLLCDYYNLSAVTVIKTYNKLKTYTQ